MCDKNKNGSQSSIPKIQGKVLKLGSFTKILLNKDREPSTGAARANSDTRSIGLKSSGLTNSKPKIKLLNKNQITV